MRRTSRGPISRPTVRSHPLACGDRSRHLHRDLARERLSEPGGRHLHPRHRTRLGPRRRRGVPDHAGSARLPSLRDPWRDRAGLCRALLTRAASGASSCCPRRSSQCCSCRSLLTRWRLIADDVSSSRSMSASPALSPQACWLSLLFPAIAVDAPGVGLRNAIADLGGNVWRIFWVGVLAMLPLLLVTMVVGGIQAMIFEDLNDVRTPSRVRAARRRDDRGNLRAAGADRLPLLSRARRPAQAVRASGEPSASPAPARRPG